MKTVLAVLTMTLAALMLEDRARQVAGDAEVAGREATHSLERNVKQQPLLALALAGAFGFVFARIGPRL